MGYDDGKLSKIYDKTNGYCHLCAKKLSYKNYASRGSKGAWEVDHSRPRANGGSHHMNNLYPACVECNNEKGTMHKKTIRKRKGYYDEPSNSNNCYLTTACVTRRGLTDDCHQLQVLRQFRNEYIAIQKNGKQLLEEYYRFAPSIVTAINMQSNAEAIYSTMYGRIQEAVELIESGKFQKAFSLYQRMANKYKKEYL